TKCRDAPVRVADARRLAGGIHGTWSARNHPEWRSSTARRDSGFAKAKHAIPPGRLTRLAEDGFSQRVELFVGEEVQDQGAPAVATAAEGDAGAEVLLQALGQGVAVGVAGGAGAAGGFLAL